MHATLQGYTVSTGLREIRNQEGTHRFYRFRSAAARPTHRFYRVAPFLSTTRNRNVTEISVTTELAGSRVPTALRLADYDREDEGAWLLLESAPVAEEAAEEAAPAAEEATAAEEAAPAAE